MTAHQREDIDSHFSRPIERPTPDLTVVTKFVEDSPRPLRIEHIHIYDVREFPIFRGTDIHLCHHRISRMHISLHDEKISTTDSIGNNMRYLRYRELELEIIT